MNLGGLAVLLKAWRKNFLLETFLWLICLMLVWLAWRKLNCETAIKLATSIFIVGLGASFISPLAGSWRDFSRRQSSKRERRSFRRRKGNSRH